MEDDGELAEGLEAVRHRGVALADALQRVDVGREMADLARIGSVAGSRENEGRAVADDGVDVRMHDLTCLRAGNLDHVQDWQAGLALRSPGLAWRIGLFVVDDRVSRG